MVIAGWPAVPKRPFPEEAEAGEGSDGGGGRWCDRTGPEDEMYWSPEVNQPRYDDLIPHDLMPQEVIMAARMVAVTLPEELYDLVERARAVEHRSRSEVIQEALRTHFGEAVYRPSEEERAELVAALDAAQADPESLQDWSDVRKSLRDRR